MGWKSKLGTNGTEAPPPHSLIARAQWGPSTAQWGPNTLLLTCSLAHHPKLHKVATALPANQLRPHLCG